MDIEVSLQHSQLCYSFSHDCSIVDTMEMLLNEIPIAALNAVYVTAEFSSAEKNAGMY